MKWFLIRSVLIEKRRGQSDETVILYIYEIEIMPDGA